VRRLEMRERLQADMRAALRAREAGRLRLSVLRLAWSAVQRAEIDRRRPLDDAEVMAILAREVRQREDTLAAIADRGREEAEAQLRAEIEVLRAYLPEPLQPEALEALVREVVAGVGATSPRDMGRVMAALLPRVQGRAPGAAVQATVRRLLGG
jgi:uncharacterized protein YqeY